MNEAPRAHSSPTLIIKPRRTRTTSIDRMLRPDFMCRVAEMAGIRVVRTRGFEDSAPATQTGSASPRPNAVFADPFAEHFGHDHGPVGLLAVFEDGEDGSSAGDGGAVERVDETRSLLARNFVADVEPAGLV